MDFRYTNHGSVCLLEPVTEAARKWVVERIMPEAQWFGRSIAIEPRYVSPILAGIHDDGLTAR